MGDDTWGRAQAAVRAYVRCLREGRPFEAHEALETAWREPGGPLASDDVAQGLIQLAAAYVHRARNHPDGARILRDRVLARLGRVKVAPGWSERLAIWRSLGVDLEVLVASLPNWREDPQGWPAPRDIPGVSGPGVGQPPA